MPRKPGFWWKASHGCYYTKRGGKLVRLDPDPVVAQALFSSVVTTGSMIPHPYAQQSLHGPRGGSWSVAELVSRYLDDAAGRMRPATVKILSWSLSRFVKAWGSLPADQVRPHHVQSWLAEPSWSRSSRNVYGGHVKMMLRWATDQGYLASFNLARLRLGKTERTACISENAARRFEAAIPNEALRDWWIVALSCGARPGELYGLAANDLADDHRSAQVRGKTGERNVHFADQGIEVIKRLAVQFPTGSLLRNNRGEPWTKTSIVMAFSRVSQVAGVEVTPKQSRKLFASRAISAGVNPAIVAHLLGHCSFDMSFRHYVGFEASTLADAMSRIR